MKTHQNTYKASEEYHEKPQVQKVITSIVEKEIFLVQKRTVKLLYNKYGLLQLHKLQNTSISFLYKIMEESELIYLHVETTLHKTVTSKFH